MTQQVFVSAAIVVLSDSSLVTICKHEDFDPLPVVRAETGQK